MKKNTSSVKKAWSSRAAKRASLMIMLLTFAIGAGGISLLQERATEQREQNLINIARSLASTTLTAGSESEEIILKVSDLLNVEHILGVTLLEGDESPLRAGDTRSDFPAKNLHQNQVFEWGASHQFFDVAFKLNEPIKFDWIVLRISTKGLFDHFQWDKWVLWILVPVLGILNALFYLVLTERYFIKPAVLFKSYLTEHKNNFISMSLSKEVLEIPGEIGEIAREVETIRKKMSDAKSQSDTQARFLAETPFPLLRCSINRKVLYANAAARAQNILFGDENKEIISPVLTELIRKAFLEGDEIIGDIKNKDQLIRFKVIPVLDAGYVNLYGETLDKEEGDFI